MELRHVRYFLAVAEEKNFTRAAARVGIGQPPLSQQIKDLESEVGTNLFQRLPQGAELTEAGRAFLEIVKGFPAQAERAVRAAQRAARGESGTLRVGFTGSAVFNPVVAGAVLLFTQVFKQPLKGLARGYYRITGSWDNPVVERIKSAGAAAATAEAPK